MKRIRKFIACLIMLAMLVAIMPNDLFVEANNNEGDVSKRFNNVEKGDILTVDFKYKVDTDNINLNGLKFEKCTPIAEGYRYFFTADKAMKVVTIELFYKEGQTGITSEHESGEGNVVGTPGEGESGEIDWDSFDLGKNVWDNSQGYDKHYAIRIDAAKYQDYDYIYVIDNSVNLNPPKKLRVSKLQPDATNKVVNVGSADFEVVEQFNNGQFITKIKVDKLSDGESLRYDMVYFMNAINKEQPATNTYRIVTKAEDLPSISGGIGVGTPEEENEEDVEDNEFPPIMPEPPALISVEVAKEWVGEALEEVEVALLRDGEIVATQILSEDNNWEHTFESLHKYNNIGEHYYYSIEELTLDDRYAVQYKEVDDYKWKVINTLKKVETEEDIDDEAVVEDIDDGNTEDNKDEDEEVEEGTQEEEDDVDNNTNEEEQDTDNDNLDQQFDVEKETPHDNNDQLVLPKTGEGAAVEYILLGAVLLIIAIILKTKE